MASVLQRLRAAVAQATPTSSGALLSAVVQEQHPASPLTPAGQRQFAHCCQQLAATSPQSVEHLLLAADVCFNYAYCLPRTPGPCPAGCPRHPMA